MPLSFASSELVALAVESVLYGVYFVLFTGCIRVLYSKRRQRGGGNHRLIIVSSVLFILITWHEVLDIIRLYLAYQGSETNNGADLYYVNVKGMTSVMKTSVYLVVTVVSDLFILYRCYVVWNASILIIILPALLYLADIVTGILALYTLTLIGQNVVFNEEQERITNAFFACTLSVNAVCTGLIAFRIWQTQKQTRDAKLGSNLSHISIIVVESGAIYVTVLACVVASYTTKSFLFNIFLDITSPVIGIVFSLIIVRIGLGVSSEETRHRSQSVSFSTVPSKTYTGNSSRPKGPIVFRTTTTTQFTDPHESDTTFKASESQGAYKMEELRGDADSSVSA
ncbi:hypothetical protein BJV74DRAFT_858521 [Russula compacta]|nr:hypothetical protein BJV74DRAFT_858521 [Russula compacta]